MQRDRTGTLRPIMSANHFDQTALAVSKAVTITGGTTAVIGGLTLYELGVWVGIIGVILGYLSGQYWSWRKDRRERLEQEQREQFRCHALEAMKAGKWNTWQDPTDGEAPRG